MKRLGRILKIALVTVVLAAGAGVLAGCRDDHRGVRYNRGPTIHRSHSRGGWDRGGDHRGGHWDGRGRGGHDSHRSGGHHH